MRPKTSQLDKSAITWYDKCMLRYSNVNFFGVASWSPAFIGKNTANQPDFYSLTLLDSLIKCVNVADKLYDTDNLTMILSGQSMISYNSGGFRNFSQDIS